MSDWTTIPADTFETDRPVLGSTHLAIVENFSALAEGSAGAPKVTGFALDEVYLGNIFRRNTTDGIGFNDLDNCRGVFCTGYCSTTGNVGGLRIRYSNDNGVSFGAWQGLARVSFNGLVDIHIDLITGIVDVSAINKTTTNNDLNNQTEFTQSATSVPSGVNAFQLGVDGAGNQFGFRLSCFAIGGAA